MARKPRKSIAITFEMEKDLQTLCKFTGQKETEIFIQALTSYLEQKIKYHVIKVQAQKSFLGLED